MKITLEAKPLEYQVEVPGYGLFTVRKMGAGVEADIASRLREMNEKSELFDEEYKDIVDQEKKLASTENEAELKKLKDSEKYKMAIKAQEELSRSLGPISEELMHIQLGLWDCEDKEALRRFLNDFTIEQIRGFYKQVMEQVDKQEEVN